MKMKKLMTVCAACLVATMAAAQVESQNIVGYQTLTASGQYYSSGPTFITVGSTTGEWKLGSIVGTGMIPQADVIQFLSTTTAGTYLTATYVDLDAAGGDAELVGWYDFDLENMLNDQTFAAGTAFLCNFSSAGVELQYAGEVLQGSTTLDLSGQQYPFIANFTPVDLTLGDLSATGMVPQADIIQFLSTASAGTYLTATYVDLDAAGGDAELVGWYDFDLENMLNDQALPAGAAVLGNFSSSAVMITFPNPVQ